MTTIVNLLFFSKYLLGECQGGAILRYFLGLWQQEENAPLKDVAFPL
jgi:hypothetical protein